MLFCNLKSNIFLNAVCLFLSVLLQTGKTVTSASTTADGKFSIKVEKRTVDFVEYVEANYLMIASGSSEQVASKFQLFCSLFFLILFMLIFFLTCIHNAPGI